LTWDNKVFNADQALTIKEAMRAHTIDAAYASFDENIKGSLEPGKIADLVVWTEDLYALEWQQLFKTTVDLTIVGGKIVYQKP
jgi:predicted amidohydrolase YtcJ